MHLGALLILAAACYGAVVASLSPTCSEIKIPIQATALNTVFPADLNLTALLFGSSTIAPLPELPTATVGGQFTIAARLCAPATSNTTRQNTLQVLVHGSTYTRNYWSGIGAPGTRPGQDLYSWVQYASNEGYYTLSIDSLCSGESSRLDPIAECQVSLEVEAVRAVIETAQSGTLPGFRGRSFNNVVYVGHSFGSMIGNALAVAHPAAVDAYVLTGFTGNISNGAAGAVGLPAYLPATIVDPARYLGFDPGYLLASSASGARQIFYDGSYDLNVANLDFQTRGTLTVGEILTGTQGQSQAPAFTGPVFVLNGNEDEIFCEPNGAAQLSGAPGNCSASYSASVRGLYPRADPFAFHNVPQTGHCLGLHTTAQQAFRAAHDFLSLAGY